MTAYLASNVGADPATKGVRVQRDPETLPQTAQSAIFTISGGHVLLLGIVGVVTTVIQNQANNTKLVANPSASGAADFDLCAVANIANVAANSVLGITGTAADALLTTALAFSGLPFPAALSKPVYLPPGTLDLSCAASNTGAVSWSLWYLPVISGAAVVGA